MSPGERGIRLDRVSKHYGAAVAVDDVTLDIEPGEFVTLLGPSGCGKSTLLRMISGFADPSAGDIRIDGRSIVGLPPFRRDTAMVFQDYALFPHRTVAQNLAFGLRMRRLARPEIARRVERMLAMIELPGMGGRRIDQISGGQAQRVALGRSLIVEPAVLLLDEPLGALDLKLRRQMQSELKRIQREMRLTFLYVTHDQEEALTMSDRIAVMRGGRVEQYGTPAEIYNAPRTAFVADFVGEANLLPVEIASVEERLVHAHGRVLRAAEAGFETVRSGDGASVAIRSEMVRLAPPQEPDWASLSAVVDEILFLGAAVKLVVVVEGGGRMTATLPAGTPLPARGEAVTIGWRTADARIVT
jgi:ABC-type Fe3+/spermidine/putrescine transport system ATPase subunit